MSRSPFLIPSPSAGPARGHAVAPTRPVRRALVAAVALCCVLCPAAGSSAAEAKAVFVKNCASCHGPDGRAKTPIAKKIGVKDLTQSRVSDADIERQIREGKNDPHGKTLMPSFKGKLTPDEIKSLVVLVKALRN